MHPDKNIIKTEIAKEESDSEEGFLLSSVQSLIERLKQKYNYSSEDVINLVLKEETLVPVEIFSFNLAPAESLTKYLKENCGMGFSEISKMINRNEKSLWQNYKRATAKMPAVFSIYSKLKIPLSAFSDSKRSIFECLITYLKEKLGLRNIKIASMLGKNPSNIWSVYTRASKKHETQIK